MNLSTRTAVLLALASAVLTTVVGTAQASTVDLTPRNATAHATVADRGDEPEDVELDEAGRPDVDED